MDEAVRANGYTFSYTDVSCEMYSYKDVTGKNVTLILVGSCALTVSIKTYNGIQPMANSNPSPTSIQSKMIGSNGSRDA